MMRYLLLSAALFLAFALPAASIADNPRFIGDLTNDPDRWESLEGIALEIEGRVVTVSRGEMRMHGSRLHFILPADQRPRAGRTYKVRGEMQRVDGKSVFVVRQLDSYPSDDDRLRAEEARLKADVSDGWIELADKYLARAKYYEDDDLQKEATQTLTRGLNALILEAGDDLKKLQSAAETAAKRGVDDVASSAHHRAARLSWEKTTARLEDDRDRAITEAELLLDRISRDLPGAVTPMKEFRDALASAYGRDPFGVYNQVDAEQREMIHRLLYSEIVAAIVRTQLLPNGSNADELADKLAKRLPDRPDLEAIYRERSIASTMESIATLSEADLQAFVKRLKESGQAKRAEVALDGWLESRLESARQRGPSLIFDVAKDYSRLKGDEEKAVELFQEALKADSRLVAAERALVDRGYEQVGGRWRKKKVEPRAAIPEGVKMGEVRVGMTDNQVRTSLRTAPDSVVRMATLGEVTEVWVYNDFNRVITLRRIGNAGEARVEEVGEIE